MIPYRAVLFSIVAVAVIFIAVMASLGAGPAVCSPPQAFTVPTNTYLMVFNDGSYDIRNQSDVTLMDVPVSGPGVTVVANGFCPLADSHPNAIYECVSPSEARKAILAYEQSYTVTFLYDVNNDNHLVGILVGSNYNR